MSTNAALDCPLISDLSALSPLTALMPARSFHLIDRILAGGTWNETETAEARDLLPCWMRKINRPWHPKLVGVIREVRNLLRKLYTDKEGCEVPYHDSRITSGELVNAPEESTDDSCSTFDVDGSWAPNKGIRRKVVFYDGAVCCNVLSFFLQTESV